MGGTAFIMPSGDANPGPLEFVTKFLRDQTEKIRMIKKNTVFCWHYPIGAMLKDIINRMAQTAVVAFFALGLIPSGLLALSRSRSNIVTFSRNNEFSCFKC